MVGILGIVVTIGIVVGVLGMVVGILGIVVIIGIVVGV